jgi:hypothetical protein
MLVASNSRIFIAIATEALAECERLSAEGRRPKPDGSPGNIITFDPKQGMGKEIRLINRRLMDNSSSERRNVIALAGC